MEGCPYWIWNITQLFQIELIGCDALPFVNASIENKQERIALIPEDKRTSLLSKILPNNSPIHGAAKRGFISLRDVFLSISKSTVDPRKNNLIVKRSGPTELQW